MSTFVYSGLSCRPIYSVKFSKDSRDPNFDHFWGAKTLDFGHMSTIEPAHFGQFGEAITVNFGQFEGRENGDFGTILGRRPGRFRADETAETPIWAIFGAPRPQILVKSGPLSRPILVDSNWPKQFILVNSGASRRRIFVHFRPPSQPISGCQDNRNANLGHFSGAKTPAFGQIWTSEAAYFG